MRLLKCTEKTVVEFVGDSIPRYAILSHTWEDKDDEVVFSDLENGSEYHSKKCWPKVESSCEQALRDGLEYIWIDTICIDKSSSAELSEAINSMFKWYRNAAICYAYLSDVPQVGLEHSRWFSRGWTLQEMIAPREIRFYDANWVALGTKFDLLQELCDISGVDTTALRGGNLRFFSVARKMSWASRRQTTREEDIAYCLLGIFDISMPLLYGEGSKAFIRLQEQIIKEYDDESLFAWRSASPGHTSGILAPSPEVFSTSANIVPCLTPAAMQSMSGPITITSRGIRMEVPVERLEEGTVVYLVRLNCKAISLDRESGFRVGIIVRPLAKIEGYPVSASMYGRARPDVLHMFTPNPRLALQTIFLLKENHLLFDLIESDVFLIRTMPRWPDDLGYRLHRIEPLAAWDKDHAVFRQPKSGTQPLVLVFSRDSSEGANEYSDYFITAFGRVLLTTTTATSDSRNGFLKGRIWCDVKYIRIHHSAAAGSSLELQNKFDLRHFSREEKSVTVRGGGMKLTCHVRPEFMSGKPLFCVDLLAKDERQSLLPGEHPFMAQELRP